MRRLRVYLDIDGTILFDAGNDETLEGLDFQHVCDGLAEFLEFVVAHCEPFLVGLSGAARLRRPARGAVVPPSARRGPLDSPGPLG